MNKPADSVIINVCVIPSQEVGAQCVGLSQGLKSNATMFALDGESKFAHMTVFMARFANDQLPNVVKAVGEALRGQQSFLCEHTGYFLTEGRYLEASYRRSEGFMRLHENLVGALSGLRLNPGQPYEEGYFTPYTAEQQRNAQETGYDLAHELYRPHVTLTRYFEGAVPEAFPALPSAKLSFQLSTVCAYKADDNGAVYEKLHEFTI